MGFFPNEFSEYLAQDCNRADFIQEWLESRGVNSNRVVIDGKNHILVQFGSSSYNPQFKIKTVIGQDEIKKSLAVAFFKYLTERLNEDKLKKDGKELTKSNILLTGLSGNGKTYTIEQLCKILDLDYIVVKCASITSPGFKGGDIEDELRK